MLRLSAFILAILTSVWAMAYPSYGQRWPHRSVFYFAPTQDKHVEQFILDTLLNDCALSERDVVTIIVTQDGYSKPSWIEKQFDITTLFSLFQVNPKEHTAILIGKDGAEKMRWGKTTDWHKVKQTIDNMPLRQQEMKNKADPCSI
ncbi:DUF4174 domain-containing protein [Vibrio sp. 404]|uniref:DUF4174 domain-containing protein n=2 Tax=Vibrio marinisediminis TaxID=2758441 RepID=A0A7W2FMD3_9VIBR|nr:DUF4174 domain-containing protein [Vibrio marinisediminis]